MATETEIQAVFKILSERPECHGCRINLRFGDLDCPHCGAEIDDQMREWAARLVDTLAGIPDSQ